MNIENRTTNENWTSNPVARDVPQSDADLLTEIRSEARYARTLANITRRALTLWDDGYTVAAVKDCGITTLHLVDSPRGDRYYIHIEKAPIVFGHSCDCPAHAKYGTCKHLQAVEMRIRAEADADDAQAAIHDALAENAETSEGCDPYAEM